MIIEGAAFSDEQVIIAVPLENVWTFRYTANRTRLSGVAEQSGACYTTPSVEVYLGAICR